jgi:N-acyl-D-amino-acid deacylase
MIGSDSGAKAVDGPLGEGNPHPRAYGTFPRVLQQFVREEGLLTLEEAVRKMTSDPLKRVGIHDRGLIREGFAADLVLFDLNEIRDPATYEEPKRYPEGIKWVLVNGETVVQEGEHTGKRPGVILKRVQKAEDG